MVATKQIKYLFKGETSLPAAYTYDGYIVAGLSTRHGEPVLKLGAYQLSSGSVLRYLSCMLDGLCCCSGSLRGTWSCHPTGKYGLI